MYNILIAPDKFKGTITSREFCEIVEKEINSLGKGIEVTKLPLADGGEGTLECLNNYYNGNLIELETYGPNGNPINAKVSISGNVAIIESSAACGLKVATVKNPLKTTTYGVGELIKKVIALGATTIIVGLGGSATNDCGCGMLASLGIKFFNKKDEIFVPTGENLKDVARIDDKNYILNNINIQFICLTDVLNKLYGKFGASYVYAKQKGASPQDIVYLEKNVIAFYKFLKKHHKAKNFKGAGAAGGMGLAFKNFMNADVENGMDFILHKTNFLNNLKITNCLITGEGKLDGQSKFGKVCLNLYNKAKVYNIKTLLFCGVNEMKNVHKFKGLKVIEINDPKKSLQENLDNTKENLTKFVKQELQTLKLIEQFRE